MPTPTTPPRPLAELLADLEAAVRAGERARAIQLEQAILQRLANGAADRAGLERRVRALMAALEEAAAGTPISTLDLVHLERGSASPHADGVVYPVWFGTNRKPTAQGDGFTGERHDRIALGRVEVHVPEAHRFGETGTGFWQRLRRFDLRDDRLRLQHVERQERKVFFADIHQAIEAARASGEPPHALVFLHGFNVTFADAAIRAAQIGCDLKVPGATAFFSWPSRGSVAAYPVDEASIEASEPAITEFLVDFTAHCRAERVHVIAHSMGNRGLLRALQRIAANAETLGQVTFGQVFLAAPDVDRDLFLDLARLYPAHAERTTLYASDGDLPVHLSAKLHDAPRAGYFTPYTVAPGVDTVAVPDFDIDLLGHSYFAQAEALLHDIHDLMRHNEAPAQRQRITPAVHEGTAFWRLSR
ncbi:MAG: alpha/beta hydrolase [candidate division NC10 bacterium]|nr:alpha/beta hydrolase [candidate division NC10 bacterium]